MAWMVQFDESLNIVRSTYSGNVTPRELQSAFIAALELAKSKGCCRFFANCQEIESGHSSVDLYFLISQYAPNGLNHSMKEAVLLPKNQHAAKDILFYETACLNRGFNVRAFADTDKAINWLTAGQTISE